MKTMLAVLQMNSADDAVLEWTRLFTERFKPEHLVLLALDRPIEMEAEIAEYLPELMKEEPPVVELLDYLEERRTSCASFAKRVETELRRGVAWREVLSAASDIGADLVLLPRSLSYAEDRGSSLSLAARRVVRKVPCDVLCTADVAPAQLSRICVPVDFSDRSRGAVRTALRLVDPRQGHVSFVHVYSVPRGAATKPADLEAIGARLETALIEKVEAFVADALPAPTVRTSTIVKQSPASTAAEIATAVRTTNAELLCLGSRGRTPLAALALGSVAEEALEQVEVAVYVHKEKGETMGLLEALGL